MVGTIGVSYDEGTERIVVVAEELVGEDEESSVARFSLTLEQAAAFAIVATSLVEAGRPPCPLCGLPARPLRSRLPANQRPPPADDVSAEAVPEPAVARRVLAEGEVTVHGRIAGSSNVTLFVTCELEGTELAAVYKPARGERPLWDFPTGLHRREVAAYVLSETLGWGFVPLTIERHDAPLGIGSLQLFVDEDGESHYFTLRDETALAPTTLHRLAVFDVVANNADRKSGHVLLADDRLWAIDNGLSFHCRAQAAHGDLGLRRRPVDRRRDLGVAAARRRPPPGRARRAARPRRVRGIAQEGDAPACEKDDFPSRATTTGAPIPGRWCSPDARSGRASHPWCDRSGWPGPRTPEGG